MSGGLTSLLNRNISGPPPPYSVVESFPGSKLNKDETR